MVNENHIFEIVTKHHRTNSDKTNNHRRDSQQNQRESYNPRSFMGLLTRSQTMVMIMRSFFVVMITMMFVMVSIICFAKTFFTVEYEEIHPERIERSDEHTRNDSKVSKP